MTLQQFNAKIKDLEINYWFLVIGLIVEIILISALVIGLQALFQ